MGGRVSAAQIGLRQVLTDGNYNFIDRDKETDKHPGRIHVILVNDELGY